jgi:hypothetical protein
MFLLKTAFWLTLVTLLLPRLSTEDLPSAASINFLMPAALANDAIPAAPETTCFADAPCVTASALIGRLQDAARDGIARARAELKAQKELQKHSERRIAQRSSSPV